MLAVKNMVNEISVLEKDRSINSNAYDPATSEGEVAREFRLAIEAMTKMSSDYKDPVQTALTEGTKFCSDHSNYFDMQIAKDTNRTQLISNITTGLTQVVATAVPWFAAYKMVDSLAKEAGDTNVGGDYVGRDQNGDNVGGDKTGRDNTGRDNNRSGDQDNSSRDDNSDNRINPEPEPPAEEE
jgi:hypothetical protein